MTILKYIISLLLAGGLIVGIAWVVNKMLKDEDIYGSKR